MIKTINNNIRTKRLIIGQQGKNGSKIFKKYAPEL